MPTSVLTMAAKQAMPQQSAVRRAPPIMCRASNAMSVRPNGWSRSAWGRA